MTVAVCFDDWRRRPEIVRGKFRCVQEKTVY